MVEEWKKIIIQNIETSYSVSNLGRVRNDKTYTFLSGYLNNGGYQMVHLRSGIDKMCSVHRLVMKAFLPCENQDDLQINHIDGDKTNNVITNLEWSTSLENMRHSYLTGLQKKEMRPCYVYDLQGNFLMEFLSAYEASKHLPCDQSSIQDCLQEKYSHCHEYQFKTYKKDKIAPWNDPHKQSEVWVYYENGDFIKHYNSVDECAKEYGVGKSTIYRRMNGTRSLKGFVFSKIPL